MVFGEPLNAAQLGVLSLYDTGGLPVVAPALFHDYYNRPRDADAPEEEESSALLAISVHTDDACDA